MKGPSLKRTVVLYVSSILVVHVLVVWNVRELIWKGYPDFTIYYTAGTMIRHGMGHSLYDDVEQFKVQRQFAPQVATRLAALPFNHPAFEALLYVPFSCLSYHSAFFLWALTNLVMLAFLPILLGPYVPALNSWPLGAWTIAGLAFFPIFFALLQGQDAILLLFLYALTFLSLKKDRLVSAGAWLACGLFKFHLVLPFLLLWLIQERPFQRKKKILLGFLSVAILLTFASFAAVGTQQMMAYPRYVLGLEKTMARGAIMPSDMPNLRGMLYLIAANHTSYDLLVVLLSAVVFVWAAWRAHSPDDHSNNMADCKFSLAVFATLLVSYHALGYDLCILAVPLLLLAGQLKNRAGFSIWPRTATIVGMAALLLSPLALVLLMRYNHLALLGWAPLLCFGGLASAMKSQLQRS